MTHRASILLCAMALAFGFMSVIVAQQFVNGTATITGTFTITAAPAVYYVDTNGSDFNNGLTLATAWQHINYALQNGIAVGNCTVMLSTGQVFQEPSIVWLNSGASSNNPVLLTSSGTTPAIISNNPANLTFFGLLQMAGNYQTVSNVTFQGNTNQVTNTTALLSSIAPAVLSVTNPTGCGVCWGGSGTKFNTNLSVVSCLFSNLSSGPYFFSSNDTSGVVNGLISNNTIVNMGFAGISTCGLFRNNGAYDYPGMKIIGNTISNVFGIGTTNFSGNGIQADQITNGLVAGNTIHDLGINTQNGPQGGSGCIVAQYGFNVTIASNECYRSRWWKSSRFIGR